MTTNTDRQKLIRRLLTTQHLNVVEREIFANNPITVLEVTDIIKFDLTCNAIFPTGAGDTQNIFEGFHIEKSSEQDYKLICQRHHPTNPFQLAENNQRVYSNFEKLIYDYLDKEYKFNIDGLEIAK